uniref:Ubiquitin-conjugating enzyme E2 2 n=1 Tax=Ganoderma boninense TaxID=34458 RepID=A0A5K1JZ33_9APHY|nr:Ubiquitin-conjugating enzyme E2 2 [Ganoderma boninense]
MALENGRYHIFSKVDHAAVGRNPVEDKTFLPKSIYKLPTVVKPSEVMSYALPFLRFSRRALWKWVVEKLPNGNYGLQIRRADVGDLNGRLVAFLPEAVGLVTTLEWTIQRDERDAEGNSYISGIPGHLPDRCGPITVGVGIPPFYPPTEVFFFKKVESE